MSSLYSQYRTSAVSHLGDLSGNGYWSLLRRLPLLALVLLPLGNLARAETAPAITINGGPASLRDNIREYITIADESCAAPLWRLQSLLGNAEEEIEKAAQALGFYQTTFTTELTQHNNCWQLQIELTPGEQVNVSEVRVIINGDALNDREFKRLVENPGIKRGDALNHGHYDNLKSRIATLASSRGYFDGHFEVTEIKVNIRESTAAIELMYDSGTRYKVGDIRISHNILGEKFLRRYLVVQEGDYYDSDKLLELKNLYNKSNYFNVATATPDVQHLQNYEVPVNIVLEERKRRAYSIGLGAATDTGPRILLGFEDRYVNKSGHSITADLDKSRVDTNFEFAYTIPMENPSYEYLKLLAGYEKEDIGNIYSSKRTLGSSYTYYQTNQWLHTYAINFENERSQIGDEPMSTANLIIPSVTFSRTQTDGNPYPLKGWSFVGRLSGSPKTFGSDLSFLQFNTRAKYIHALPIGRVLLRGELGATQVNDFDELPVSKRYIAGGDTSVRGYQYRSLGPKDDDDKEVVGGNNLLVGSIEYDYLFRPKWALATFYDIGNAANDFNMDLKRSAGVGVRWISPVGPIRLDFAQTLDDAKEWRIIFTMGPDL